MEKIKYQVCIRCYTYNQAKYILDALNSFVIQKTTFPFIVVVVDDASTDGESDIIREFVEDNFNVRDKTISYERETELANIIYSQHTTNKNCHIVAILLKRNLYKEGAKKSIIVDEWREQSKYEALCEGDDWWLTDDKIQKQYEAMEEHPEVDMCACGAICYKNNKEVRRIVPKNEKRILTVEETIVGGGGFIATSSLMQRVSILHDNYKFWRHFGLDLFMQIHGSLRGGIYFLPECMAAYRISANGSWTQQMMKQPEKYFFHIAKVQETFLMLNQETERKYDNIIKDKLYKNYLSMFVFGLDNNLFSKNLKRYSLKEKIKTAINLFK